MRGAAFMQILPPQAAGICYNKRRHFNSYAFVALLARVKPGKLYGEPRWGECAPGRISFRDFSKAFPGPHSESNEGLRPFFPLLAPKQRAQEKKV